MTVLTLAVTSNNCIRYLSVLGAIRNEIDLREEGSGSWWSRADQVYLNRRGRKHVTPFMLNRIALNFGYCVEGATCPVPEWYAEHSRGYASKFQYKDGYRVGSATFGNRITNHSGKLQPYYGVYSRRRPRRLMNWKMVELLAKRQKGRVL